jgi:hypothetical protein
LWCGKWGFFVKHHVLSACVSLCLSVGFLADIEAREPSQLRNHPTRHFR